MAWVFMGFFYPSSVKVPKETRNCDSNQRPGLIFSLSTTRLLMEGGVLLPLRP